MEKTQKTILWIDDNAHEESLSFIRESVEKAGFQLRIATGTGALALELDDIQSKNEDLRAIILDMLIYGVDNLDAFDKDYVSWDKDVSDVGMILLEHIFRVEDYAEYHTKGVLAKNSDDLIFLNNIPLLILTVKPHIKKGEIAPYNNVSVSHKYDDGNTEWRNDVKKWIANQ